MPQIVNIAIISTHAPAGGATIIAECEEQGIQFLLTPLREGRRHDQTFELASSNFYSRPCGRGDHGRCRKSVAKRLISTHAPAGGATGCHGHSSSLTGRISTHAPAGGATRRPRRRVADDVFISTHAPAGGATDLYKRFDPVVQNISTHAPAGGATCVFSKSEKSRYISTHAPAGGATSIGFCAGDQSKRISTHAPAGGATCKNAYVCIG